MNMSCVLESWEDESSYVKDVGLSHWQTFIENLCCSWWELIFFLSCDGFDGSPLQVDFFLFTNCETLLDLISFSRRSLSSVSTRSLRDIKQTTNFPFELPFRMCWSSIVLYDYLMLIDLLMSEKNDSQGCSYWIHRSVLLLILYN